MTNLGSIDYDKLAAAMLRLSVAPVSESGGRKSVDAHGDVMARGAEGVVVGGGGEKVVPGAVRGRTLSEVARAALPVSDDETGSEVSVLSSASSLSGGAPGAVSETVRAKITLGDFGRVYSHPGVVEVSPAQSSGAGFFAKVVRRSEALQLREKLHVLSGVKLPKTAALEVAVCTFTAGVMPDGIVSGKAKLRSLAAIGDAALTLHLVADSYMRGESVESAQSARSRLSSNVNLRTVMHESGLVSCVSYASGVNPAITVATATAFEAMVGVLVMYLPSDNVAKFLRAVGVLAELH